jgi:serine protease Do
MQLRNLILAALIGLGGSVMEGQPLRLIDVADIPTVSYLGIGWHDVNAEMAKALKLPEEGGVEVTKLDPNSPAAAAGIKEGDVLMQYGGERVQGTEQLLRLLRETPAGREVKLQIYRDGASQIVSAKIVLRPATLNQGVLVPIQPGLLPFQGARQDVPVNRMSWVSGVLGAELESLEGQLADSFGVKIGVLVRSVMRGSAAGRAGLRAGDVITQVDDAKVATATDVSGRIRASRGPSAMLTVLRDHHELSLIVAVDGIRPVAQ